MLRASGRPIGALVAAGALAACGTSSAGGAPRAASATAPSPCTPTEAAAVARRLGVPVATLSHSTYTANSGAPSCRYAARVAGAPVAVSISVDTAPQAYYRLERQVVEEGQQFGAQANAPVPQDVAHLGLDADWFPAEQDLMTTDGARLITVAVTWPGRDVAFRRAAAEAVAAATLGQAH
jgi:hypothetical protein